MNTSTQETVLLCGPPVNAVGGGPTHMRNMLASPLSERYRLVHFVSGSRGTESPAKDEPYIKKLLRIVGSPFILAWVLWRTAPAVVHLNSAMDRKGFWRDLVYLGVCKIFQKKVVLQIHGGSLTELCGRRGMARIVRSMLSRLDAVVLLASSEKRQFAEFGVARQVVVIPNGIDVTRYRGPFRRKHSGNVKRLAYLGRLISTKGIFETIEAMEILRADSQFSDIEYHIAGSGQAYQELRKAIESKGLSHCIKLVGSLHGEEKINFLRSADVFVFPSYHPEGLPYCILESLAAGTPVVASRVAGIPDVVLDGQHGVLIDARDTAQIVDAIKHLASCANLEVMSQNCQEWAVKRLGLERLASEFGALYDSLISGGGLGMSRTGQLSERT